MQGVGREVVFSPGRRAQIQKKKEKMAVKGATPDQVKLVELSTPDVVFHKRMQIEGRATRSVCRGATQTCFEPWSSRLVRAKRTRPAVDAPVRVTPCVEATSCCERCLMRRTGETLALCAASERDMKVDRLAGDTRGFGAECASHHEDPRVYHPRDPGCQVAGREEFLPADERHRC